MHDYILYKPKFLRNWPSTVSLLPIAKTNQVCNLQWLTAFSASANVPNWPHPVHATAMTHENQSVSILSFLWDTISILSPLHLAKGRLPWCLYWFHSPKRHCQSILAQDAEASLSALSFVGGTRWMLRPPVPSFPFFGVLSERPSVISSGGIFVDTANVGDVGNNATYVEVTSEVLSVFISGVLLTLHVFPLSSILMVTIKVGI